MKWIIRRLRLVAAVISILALVSVVGVLAAEVVIDIFTSSNQTVQYTIPVSPIFPHQECDYAATASGTIGDHRDICLDITGGNQDSQGRLQVSTANQYLLMALDPSVLATAAVQWDGTDANPTIDPIGLQIGPGVGRDLVDTTNSGILLRVIESDGLPVDITMRLYTDGSNWAEQTVRFESLVTGGDVVDVFMEFDDFVDQVGTMDETNVGAVELELDATISAGADMTISFIRATSLYDFGDLPAGYNVTGAEGGPRHVTGSLHLGTSLDAEADGTHSAAGSANADDNDATPDDEDGVTRQPSFTGGATHGGWTNGTVATLNGGHLEIIITGGSGYPQVFVDFGSGLTEVTLRDIFGNPLPMPLAAGTHQVYFDIPPGTFDGSNPIAIPVRVRLSSAGGLTANGDAPDGEVEDYIWNFGPNAVVISDVDTRSTSFRWMALAAGAIGLVGVGGALLLLRRKRVL
jgi:hypothetical protein